MTFCFRKIRWEKIIVEGVNLMLYITLLICEKKNITKMKVNQQQKKIFKKKRKNVTGGI